MPEVIVKYKSSRALQALKDFSKYFDFSVSKTKNQVADNLNGVTIIRGNSSIDTTGLKKIFTGRKIVAKDLRNNGWQRKK